MSFQSKKNPLLSFPSGALRTGPKAGINKWPIRSHKLAYSKRKEITIIKGVVFLQLLQLKAFWTDKSPPNLERNYGRTVSSFVDFYTHSINEAEMIKCSSFIADIVAG